jgi:hypothetical protein
MVFWQGKGVEMTTIESRPPSADWNLPLMHRLAEVLMSHDAEAFRGVDIAVNGATATLRGRVAGEEAHALALTLARTTAGVKDVIDELRVTAKPRSAAIAVAAPGSHVSHRGQAGFRSAAAVVAVLIVFGAGGLGALWAYQNFGAKEVVAAAPPPRPKVVPVEGAIYYEGRPAAEARLVFHPYGMVDDNSRRAYATADSEGKFKVFTFGQADGAVPGSYLVTVDWLPPCPPGGNADKYADLGNVAPKRFQYVHSTPLRVRVGDTSAGITLPPLVMSRAYRDGAAR